MKKLKNAAKSHKNKLLKLLDLAKNGKILPDKYFSMPFGDVSSQIKICNLILSDKLSHAAELIQGLDAVVREDIPSCIYHFAYEFDF